MITWLLWCHSVLLLLQYCYYALQILEAADRIQALDMKKRALDIIVANFPKVSLPCR